MIRVLQCVNNMHRAGLETMLMNYYRNIDRTRIQFDFLTHRPERADYDDEIEGLGGRVYYAPRLYPQNYPAYFAYMKRFFQEHPEYKIMHSHIDSMSYLPLRAGQLAGVPVRIAHSHSTAIDPDGKYLLKQYFRARLPSAATHCYACGEEAGAFLFGKRAFTVIPNAIDTQPFRFDPVIRERKRVQLGLAGKFVVGHVGRFSRPKNHDFLLEIFRAVCSRNEHAVLMLVGTGERLPHVQKLAQRLGLSDRVLFLGSRGDVNELYQAMDVFVLPSLFEGVPVVGVEAQFAALPCVVSDRVPREVMFTDRCAVEQLTTDAGQWAQRILDCAAGACRSVEISCPDYDIRQMAPRMEQRYLDLLQAR